MASGINLSRECQHVFEQIRKLKQEFPGVQKCIQATEPEEACRNAVEEQLRSLDRE